MGKVQTIKGGKNDGQLKNSPFKDQIWEKNSMTSGKGSSSKKGSY